MSYYESIKELILTVPTTIIDWEIERKRGKPPTQAFSEFLTNREQGDWAENLILQAINSESSHYIAVQYGKSENIVAGESGFEEFYEQYQDELDRLSKEAYFGKQEANVLFEDVEKLHDAHADQKAFAQQKIDNNNFMRRSKKKYCDEHQHAKNVTDNLF